MQFFPEGNRHSMIELGCSSSKRLKQQSTKRNSWKKPVCITSFTKNQYSHRTCILLYPMKTVSQGQVINTSAHVFKCYIWNVLLDPPFRHLLSEKARSRVLSFGGGEWPQILWKTRATFVRWGGGNAQKWDSSLYSDLAWLPGMQLSRIQSLPIHGGTAAVDICSPPKEDDINQAHLEQVRRWMALSPLTGCPHVTVFSLAQQISSSPMWA